MNNCKGLIGWIFGHKFGSMIVKYSPPEHGWNFSGYLTRELICGICKKEYVVICKRCGVKK